MKCDTTCSLFLSNNNCIMCTSVAHKRYLIQSGIIFQRVQKMEWPIRLIFFNPLPNAFELSFLIKTIFSIICIFIIVFALLVHQRILSFLKNNDNRHVDQIIAFQSVVNCFLIPINLSWLLGLQWFGEMRQFLSPQGCYIGSFLGTLPQQMYYSLIYKFISTVVVILHMPNQATVLV